MRTYVQKQNLLQERVPPRIARSNRAMSEPDHYTQAILRLQRTVGNQAVQRLLRAHAKGLNAGLTTGEGPQVQGGPPNTIVCPPVFAGELYPQRGGAIWHTKVTYRCILAPGIPFIGTTRPSWVTVYDPHFNPQQWGIAVPGSPAPPHIVERIERADREATAFTRSVNWGGVASGGIARCHQAFRTSLEAHLYTASPGWYASVVQVPPPGHLCP